MLLVLSLNTLRAQQMHARPPAKPSTSLTFTWQGKTVTYTPAQLSAIPHTTISVFNAHLKQQESYSGVPLNTLLDKLGVPSGEAVRGPLFLLGVIAHGTDGYQVLYSLAETDPTIHTGQVLVADTLNGQPIAADGAFKLIATEEKRPARWVRNLDSITVLTVHP